MAVRMSLAALALVAVFWLAGETHRSNCIDQHRTGCTVLPWSSGHTPDPLRGLSPAERRAVQRELDAQAGR